MGWKDNIRFWVQDIQELIGEFRMRFDENMLGKCGVCGMQSRHKMDCTREWSLRRKWNER